MTADAFDDYYSIADLLQDHEYYPVNQQGWCRGQDCHWRGTQFEWAFHVGKLIEDWHDHLTGTNQDEEQCEA